MQATIADCGRDRTLSAPATTKTPQIAPAVRQNRDLRVRAVPSGARPF
ncbi:MULTISPECIES: hypothetical protein [unclassified Microcoleus]